MDLRSFLMKASGVRKAVLIGLCVIVLSAVAEGGGTINFDDLAMGEIVHRQYQSQGAIFTTVDFDFSTLTTTPVYDGLVAYHHWVTSEALSVEPTRTGVFQLCPYPNFPAMQIEFVMPGTEQAAWTDFVSVRLDAATDDGGGSNLVYMIAFDPEGQVVTTSQMNDDIPRALLSVSGSRIHRVVVAMDSPPIDELETYDDVYFNNLVPEPGTLMLLGLGGFLLGKMRKVRKV